MVSGCPTASRALDTEDFVRRRFRQDNVFDDNIERDIFSACLYVDHTELLGIGSAAGPLR